MMMFDQCTFKQNKAHLGSAVAMTPSLFLKSSSGYTVNAKFQNCHFLENKVFVNDSHTHKIQPSTAGLGTTYDSFYDIHFEGCSYFESNWGSAVYIISGVANFLSSSASFVNNTSLQGGAVALIGSSMMIVGPNNYEFINNTAMYEGGALYVLMTDSTDFISSRSCFIQYRDNDTIKVLLSGEWNANITFVGNRAKGSIPSGHAIYATSLHPCQVVNNGTEKQPNYRLKNTSDVFTMQRVKFDDDVELQPRIATDVAVLHSGKSTPLKVIPGERYDLVLL